MDTDFDEDLAYDTDEGLESDIDEEDLESDTDDECFPEVAVLHLVNLISLMKQI